MPGPIVGTIPQSGVRALGVSKLFWDTYRREPDPTGFLARWNQVVEEDSAKADQAKYAAFEATPIPTYWPFGDGVPAKAFKDYGWTVNPFRYALTIDWEVETELWDLTDSLVTKARDGAIGVRVRDEAIWFQILRGAADPDGIPAIPLAADGAALYATTAGGVDRFGVSGGNIVASQVFSTGEGIRAGVQEVHSRFAQFQDTEGQPLLDPGSKKYLVIASADDIPALNAAFRGNFVAIGANTATSNAAITNILFDAGYSIDLIPTQRVPTGEMYFFHLQPNMRKPLIRVRWVEAAESYFNETNSDEGRKYNKRGLRWWWMTGYGVGTPFNAIKMTT
jgi:hypothetical protein